MKYEWYLYYAILKVGFWCLNLTLRSATLKIAGQKVKIFYQTVQIFDGEDYGCPKF